MGDRGKSHTSLKPRDHEPEQDLSESLVCVHWSLGVWNSSEAPSVAMMGSGRHRHRD